MIKNILYLQPIFCPDEKRLERNIASIESMGNYVKTNGTDGINVVVLLGGWARTDELWNKVSTAINTHFGPTVVPIRFEKNYGKSMTINKLSELATQQNVKYEAIFTADSDILYPSENKHMFGRLAYAAIQLESTKKMPFGLISLNQSGENCHWKVCYENVVQYTLTTGNDVFVEKIVWPNIPSGIAGGCLFLSRKLWEIMRGYTVTGVYAGDDALALLQCGQRGFSYQMFDTLSIVHPPENDPTYAEWKRTVCQRDTLTGPKQNIDHIIKEADDFWENHGKS